MLIRSDPDTFGRAMLVFAEQSMTSNTLYIPLKDTSRDVAYVVSEENDDSNHVVVRRGPPDEKFVVADIRYNPKSTKEVGTIDFMDLKGGPISFRNWLTRGGKAGAEQKLSIDGEDHSWTQQKEGKRDSDITYSLMKGKHVVARYVPSRIDESTLRDNKSHAIRGYLEFPEGDFPEEQVLDEVVASCLVIQHLIVIDRNFKRPWGIYIMGLFMLTGFGGIH